MNTDTQDIFNKMVPLCKKCIFLPLLLFLLLVGCKTSPLFTGGNKNIDAVIPVWKNCMKLLFYDGDYAAYYELIDDRAKKKYGRNEIEYAMNAMYGQVGKVQAATLISYKYNSRDKTMTVYYRCLHVGGKYSFHWMRFFKTQDAFRPLDFYMYPTPIPESVKAQKLETPISVNKNTAYEL